MAPQKKVLIAAPPFAKGRSEHLERLVEAGLRPVDLRPCLNPLEPVFRAELKDAWALIPGNLTRVDQACLDLAPELRVIAKIGVGLDNIDIQAASSRGILVFNTPGVNTEAVAEYTLGMILALSRRIIEADQVVRGGEWTKLRGMELGGRTLGLVGLGAIGQAVAKRANAFGMDLLALDPLWPEDFAARHGVKKADLKRLLSSSDVVSLHCPLIPETRNLIDQEALWLMKPTALLINTARGELVDEAALAQALESGRLGGAAECPQPLEPVRVGLNHSAGGIFRHD